MKERVFTILLVYNTPYERLKDIVNSILHQTHPIDKLLIWDNASKNKIEEFLLEEGILNNEKIIYHKSQQNYGAGGGFNKAISYLEKNFL